MDFEIPPLPIETEFKISSVKHRLYQLSREELEALMIECLSTMTKLAHQTKVLRNYIVGEMGKTPQD
jgi:hypothetical protein